MNYGGFGTARRQAAAAAAGHKTPAEASAASHAERLAEIEARRIQMEKNAALRAADPIGYEARYSELESRMKKEMHQTEVAARARSLSRNGAYVTLGLRSGANIESIDDAYRRLSANYHPDKGGNLSKLYDIEAAYSVLKQGGGTRKRKRHIALRRARKTRRSRR